MPVQLCARAVATRAEFDAGDIFQAHQLAHLTDADNDIGKVFRLI